MNPNPHGLFIGVVSEDGKKLRLDYPDQFKAYYAIFAGDEVEIEIRKRRSKRSLRQNAWLHSFLTAFAKHLGYTLPELKLVGLVAVFGTHEVMGYTVPVEPHTSKLNTEQMSDLCEWYVQQGAEMDPPFLILYPEEFRRQKRKKAKAA